MSVASDENRDKTQTFQFDVDEYFNPHEPEQHWMLRRKFLEQNMGRFSEDRLVCLGQTFANMEFTGCRYPQETMDLVEELAFGVVQEYREEQKSRLKRTFVSGSDAAGARVNRGRFKGSPDASHSDPPSEDEASSPKGGLGRIRLPWRDYLLVLLDWADDEHPCNIMNRSAAFCRTTCSWETLEDAQGPYCEAKIGPTLLANARGATKPEARDEAVKMAIEKLRKNCYTLRVKNKYLSDGTPVALDDLREKKQNPENTTISQNNVGHKLLKLMGWSGGGLGKGGSGIAEPITASAFSRGEGLGAAISNKNFRRKVTGVIKEYAKGDGVHDLVFTSGFTNEQRKEMHMIALRLGLKSKSLGKDENRFLTISRKLNTSHLIEDLLATGGDNAKYTLIPPPTS